MASILAHVLPLEGHHVLRLVAVMPSSYPTDPVIKDALPDACTGREHLDVAKAFRGSSFLVLTIFGGVKEVLQQPLATLEINLSDVRADELDDLFTLDGLEDEGRDQLVAIEFIESDDCFCVPVPEALGLLTTVVQKTLNTKVSQQAVDDEVISSLVLGGVEFSSMPRGKRARNRCDCSVWLQEV